MPVSFLKRFLFFCCTCLASFATLNNSVLAQPSAKVSKLKFLGKYVIPYGLSFNNTTVGGLSGIDYDAANNRYFLISDDRSAVNPARFYTASIFVTKNGIDSVHFTGVKNILQPNGKLFPGNKEDPYHTPDPEAMRYNPVNKQLVWSSEGERIVRTNDTILENPAITTISTEGKYINSFSLPPNLAMHPTEKGPRQNGTLEGLTFADNYISLFANVEEPLYEDGPRADTSNTKTYIRILQFDVAGRRNTKQFAYLLEPVAHPPFPAGAFKINGVSDMLSIGKNKLLVMERSFSSGRLDCTIKLFIVDVKAATDIKDISSLKNSHFVAASKQLLLNMDNLGIYIDNVEGVTFGPVLPNGHKTLVFVADNNFNPLEQSQLLLFEVVQ